LSHISQTHSITYRSVHTGWRQTTNIQSNKQTNTYTHWKWQNSPANNINAYLYNNNNNNKTVEGAGTPKSK